MHNLGDQSYMTQEKRDTTLATIATGRARQARVKSVLSVLPAWTDRPFKDDQGKFDQAMKTFKAADPAVTAVETRLTLNPGSVWQDFSSEEQTAFVNWTSSLETMESLANLYFPTEDQQRYMTYVLFGVAVVSFVLPLLISDGESELTFPIHPRPIPLPPGMKPRLGPKPPPEGSRMPSRPGFRPPITPGRPTFGPTFSKLPPENEPLKVNAEVMRPATAASPWQRSSTVPASSGRTSNEFRGFVKPLGPSEPVSARTVDAVASGIPVSQTPAPSHNPHIYAKPRFRSQ